MLSTKNPLPSHVHSSTIPSTAVAVEDDDFTTSSILEFLRKEQECYMEADAESIFQEVNRLADNSDTRTIDEILREAELLMKEQKPSNDKSNAKDYGKEVRKSETPKMKDKQQTKNAVNEQYPRPETNAVVFHLSEDIKSTHLTAGANADDTDSKTRQDCAIQSQLKPLQTNKERYCKNYIDFPSAGRELDNTNTKQDAATTEDRSQQKSIIFNHSLSKPLAPETTNKKVYSDKARGSSSLSSGLSSPVRELSSSYVAPSAISREHILKQEIEGLNEKLKDTEERLQSLRIQHNSLSQVHRDLREYNMRLQEESEVLKLDVRHLNECVGILRTELQSVRADRNEAIELQNQLKAELSDSRDERKRAQEAVEKDGRVIQDLQRQCREMERILMRKHPDSVSALIVAAKNPKACEVDSVNSRKLLEQRIAQLEADAKAQDLKAQEILANVQARFNSVQAKYETHIADLETQVLSLQEINTKLNEKIESHVRTIDYLMNEKKEKQSNNSTQTDAELLLHNKNEDDKKEKVANTMHQTSSNYNNKHDVSPKRLIVPSTSSSSKATQTVVKKLLQTRDHSTNTIGTLHRQRNNNSNSNSSTSSAANSTPNNSRPNSKQSGIRKPLASAYGTATKLPVSQSDSTISLLTGTPTVFGEARDSQDDGSLLSTVREMQINLAIKEKAVQRLTKDLDECKKTIRKLEKGRDALKSEKPSSGRGAPLANTEQLRLDSVRDSTSVQGMETKIKLLEADYKALHEKRLQDLKTLQSVHERELASCHEAILMQQRLSSKMDECKDTPKHRKISVDYFTLKDKVASLEKRHTEREKRLHFLVDALSKGRFNNVLESVLQENSSKYNDC